MTSQQRYIALSKNLSILINVSQGFCAIYSCLDYHYFTDKKLAPYAILFHVIWFAFLMFQIFMPIKTPKQIKIYSWITIFGNYIVSLGIPLLFHEEDLTITTLLSQWLVAMTLLDKALVLVLVSLNVAAIELFMWAPQFHYYTSNEHMVLLFLIGLAAIVCFNFVSIIKEQMDWNEDQRLTLINMMDLLDLKYNEAQAATKAKGNFLANMSHEIRTPINSVLGFNTMIQRECEDEKVLGYSLKIQAAGRSLLNIINDILDFSKIEAGKFEILPAEYDLASMLVDEMNIIQTKLDEKGIRFVLDVNENTPAWLYGDDVRIRQVITNLLTNAAKYTSAGSVTLKVEYEPDPDMGEMAHLHFHVIDTGNGIKQEDISKLFDAFVRIEQSRNRNIEGTGIGLNIVMNILKLMDSKLEIDSVYGEGSDFHFHLKQRIIFNTPVGDVTKRALEATKKVDNQELSFTCPDARILVVDDNPMNRELFKELLKPMECHVDDVASGKECVMILASYKYDIIFMDHMMPGWDGIETMHRIKKLSPEENLSAGCPIIILTANAIAGAKEMYLSEGFDDFMSKPIMNDVLEDMIQRFLPPEKVKAGAPKPKKASTVKADEFEMVQGVDWNIGIMHVPTKEMLEKTVRNFYDLINKDAAELEELYSQVLEAKAGGNVADNAALEAVLDAYRVKVHAMKTSANIWGAFTLGGTASLLEFSSRDRKVDLVEAVTPYFLAEWRSYKEKLKPVVASEEDDGTKLEFDLGEVETTLEDLVTKLNAFDLHGSDQVLEKLKSFKYPVDMEDLLESITAAVLDFDTTHIGEWCDKMKERIKGEGN